MTNLTINVMMMTTQDERVEEKRNIKLNCTSHQLIGIKFISFLLNCTINLKFISFRCLRVY